MPFYIKDSGTWKEIIDPHVRDAGAWKEVQEGWVRDDATWKQFYGRSGNFMVLGPVETLKLTASSVHDATFGTIARCKPNDGQGADVERKTIQYKEPSAGLPKGRMFVNWAFDVVFSDNLGESWRIISPREEIDGDTTHETRANVTVIPRSDGSYIVAGTRMHPTQFYPELRIFMEASSTAFDVAVSMPSDGNVTAPTIRLPAYVGEYFAAENSFIHNASAYNAAAFAISYNDQSVVKTTLGLPAPLSANEFATTNAVGFAKKIIPTNNGFVLINRTIRQSADNGVSWAVMSPDIQNLFQAASKLLSGGDISNTGRIVGTNFWGHEIVVSAPWLWAENSNWTRIALPLAAGTTEWTRVFDAAYDKSAQMWCMTGSFGTGVEGQGLICLANENFTEMASYVLPTLKVGNRVVSLPPRRIISADDGPHVFSFDVLPLAGITNLPTSVAYYYDVANDDTLHPDALGVFAIVKVGAYPATAQQIWDVYNGVGNAANIAISTVFLLNSALISASMTSSSLALTDFGALSANSADYRFYVLLVQNEGATTPLVGSLLHETPTDAPTAECTITLVEAPVTAWTNTPMSIETVTDNHRSLMSVYDDGAGVLHENTHAWVTSQGSPLLTTIEGVVHYTQFVRTMNADTGAELSSAVHNVPVPGTSGDTLYIKSIANSRRIYMLMRGSAWYWSANGVGGTVPIAASTLLNPESAAYQVSSHTAGRPEHHNPGVGVYMRSGRVSAPTRKGIVRYASNGPDAMPGTAVLNEVIVNEVSVASGAFEILGFDTHDRVYAFADGVVYCYTAELVLVWQKTVPTLPGGSFGTGSFSLILNDGKMLGGTTSSPPANNDYRFFDISDIDNWTYFGAKTEFTAKSVARQLTQCDGYFPLGATRLSVCNIVCVPI